MNRTSPPSLFDLAKMNLLQNEMLTIEALQSLPREIFLPLFISAVEKEQSHISALDGLDGLLAKNIRTRRWKLKVLDLSNKWNVGDSRIRKRKKQPLAPVVVITNLCLMEDFPDKIFTFLRNRVKQKKCLPHLCCEKLNIAQMSLESIKEILKTVQLDYVQEVGVNCTWELPMLARFASFLGQMVNLSKFHLSHNRMISCISQEARGILIATITSQFVKLNQLQELHLKSVLFLEGFLHQLLRSLKTPLKTLWIINCALSISDLTYFSLCPSTNYLRKLCLNDVKLTDLHPECLQVLLERVSGTIQHLDLDNCGVTDSQVTAILPALGHCSQLKTLCFCGNLVSMTVLENLLRHTVPLDNFTCGLFPIPLECYLETTSPHNFRNIQRYIENLRLILLELGRPRTILFSSTCLDCGVTEYFDP
ncbi:PREDICTED: melanoma antigen preferentially expressed in tumors-like [Elephantulus edwardii]|uniref:melanoma antigen preferentially expressed in tumors-like n=1 Tax=Elephantulus edwardii TaxID=28737 RepID=UPI0003F0A1DC|nr:PREDICTED: melanoma antigen preferentially expressed in tumors-like [Elephantulus edwardii]